MSRLEPARSGWQDPILGGTSDRRRLGPRPDPRRARPPCSSPTIEIRVCLAAPKFRGFIRDRTSSRTTPDASQERHAASHGEHRAAAQATYCGRRAIEGLRGTRKESTDACAPPVEGESVLVRCGRRHSRCPVVRDTNAWSRATGREPPKWGDILSFFVSLFSILSAYRSQYFLFCNGRLRYAYGITA